MACSYRYNHIFSSHNFSHRKQSSSLTKRPENETNFLEYFCSKEFQDEGLGPIVVLVRNIRSVYVFWRDVTRRVITLYMRY